MPRPRSFAASSNTSLVAVTALPLPSLFLDAGEKAWRRVLEFFTANIRNPNTRAAYAQVAQQFSRWCERRELTLEQVSPVHVAAYIEHMMRRRSKPTVKQHLAALRMLFDYLVTGQVIETNPATSVRGPKHVVKKGLTPVLSVKEARALLKSIDASTIGGLRDRALIGIMVYAFARVGAVVAMNVSDYFPQGRRMWFRLREKGGRLHDVPAHHKAEAFMDAYIAASGLSNTKSTPLFQTLSRFGRLTGLRMNRLDALAVVKRRAADAGLPSSICCHSFRATGITAYLSCGGQLEHAQRIAGHSSPKTTKLYDRTSDEVSLDEIEKIAI